jgi:hypothetical protein
MPLSPKEKKFLANNQNPLVCYTRQQEARRLQLRTKRRIEATHAQDREKNRKTLLKEQQEVQRALLNEQHEAHRALLLDLRNNFLKAICAILLAFCAATLFIQYHHLNHRKDNISS